MGNTNIQWMLAIYRCGVKTSEIFAAAWRVMTRRDVQQEIAG